MLENSSSDFPNNSVNNSNPDFDCLRLSEGVFIITSFTITDILLLLPLFAFVLFLGFQQWRKQGSSSSAATSTSHSDVITYHMVTMEIIAMLTCALYCISVPVDHKDMMIYSIQLFSATWYVKIQFHMLTCIELYLAVVHPVTYLQRKDSSGVRIRNMAVACVWLLCVVTGIVACLDLDSAFLILYLGLKALVLIVVSCCCIAVLWALRRPGPGEGTREGVDPSKQRAFRTMLIIVAVLWLCLSGMLLCDSLQVWVLDEFYGCISISCAVWFTLPSSSVLPLLFLQRAGKLPCCGRRR